MGVRDPLIVVSCNTPPGLLTRACHERQNGAWRRENDEPLASCWGRIAQITRITRCSPECAWLCYLPERSDPPVPERGRMSVVSASNTRGTSRSCVMYSTRLFLKRAASIPGCQIRRYLTCQMRTRPSAVLVTGPKSQFPRREGHSVIIFTPARASRGLLLRCLTRSAKRTHQRRPPRPRGTKKYALLGF